MCIGLPMRIVESDGVTALVQGCGARRRVSLLVVGELPVGTAVLVHQQTALRVLPEHEVPLIERALEAAEAAQRGEPWEHLLQDLIDRTPELPEHLRPPKDTPTP
jgi:hydrogenase expression/formation protein HypC